MPKARPKPGIAVVRLYWDGHLRLLRGDPAMVPHAEEHLNPVIEAGDYRLTRSGKRVFVDLIDHPRGNDG